jgi:hypothetical protein
VVGQMVTGVWAASFPVQVNIRTRAGDTTFK